MSVKTPTKSLFQGECTTECTSPNTPVKSAKRTNFTSKEKDAFCLCCGTCLAGIKATFNLTSCRRLFDQLKELVKGPVNLNVQSCRVCRPCGRRIETLFNKSIVLNTELQALRRKFKCSAEKCDFTTHHVEAEKFIKRCAKNTPEQPKKRTKGRLFDTYTANELESDSCGVTPMDQNSENELPHDSNEDEDRTTVEV